VQFCVNAGTVYRFVEILNKDYLLKGSRKATTKFTASSFACSTLPPLSTQLLLAFPQDHIQHKSNHAKDVVPLGQCPLPSWRCAYRFPWSAINSQFGFGWLSYAYIFFLLSSHINDLPVRLKCASPISDAPMTACLSDSRILSRVALS
jgi:hypothetical protein